MSSVIAVLSFPGSNCEHDVVEAVKGLGGDARIVWHADTDLTGIDGVIVPGGFAHGDYLRCGAIARFSPIMTAVAQFASEGGPVLGVCNGFQILTEAGLLPGALMRNAGLRFICKTVTVRVASTNSILTSLLGADMALSLPINHYEGNYVCNEQTLADLERRGQIVLRYEDNPNGSTDAIAGVSNVAGNVVGLMPHPERAQDLLYGSADGRPLLQSVILAAQSYANQRSKAS